MIGRNVHHLRNPAKNKGHQARTTTLKPGTGTTAKILKNQKINALKSLHFCTSVFSIIASAALTVLNNTTADIVEKVLLTVQRKMKVSLFGESSSFPRSVQ
jgi:hypothetical protein